MDRLAKAIFANPKIACDRLAWHTTVWLINSSGDVVPHDRDIRRHGDGSSTSSRKGWNLEDAKVRFGEVVRRARSEGPQRVSVRGRAAVVVVAADEFDRLLPRDAAALPFVAFMETLSGDGLDLTRDADNGREIGL